MLYHAGHVATTCHVDEFIGGVLHLRKLHPLDLAGTTKDRFLHRTTCWSQNDVSRAMSNLHKSIKPYTCVNCIMLEWSMRQRVLEQTPDNEMQLEPSMKRRSSGCAGSRVWWVVRHLSHFGCAGSRVWWVVRHLSDLTHSILSITSREGSLKQVRAQAWTRCDVRFSTHSLEVIGLADDRTQEQFCDSEQTWDSSLQTSSTTHGTTSHANNEAQNLLHRSTTKFQKSKCLDVFLSARRSWCHDCSACSGFCEDSRCWS